MFTKSSNDLQNFFIFSKIEGESYAILKKKDWKNIENIESD